MTNGNEGEMVSLEPQSDGQYKIVEQGDCLSSIAFRHKLNWPKIWNHQKNQSLKRLSKNPNILMPGDVVWIPKLEQKTHSCQTEKRHTFVRKGVPEKLNVRFLDMEGKPFANEPYVLTIDGISSRGKLDQDGWLRANISPGASSGSIEIGQNQDLLCCNLNLGHMDPISERSGVQRRLMNLGYYDGLLDGADSEQLQRAIASFREAEKLTESDDEEAFLNRLRDCHGS
jgi:hypothetical protein